MVMTIRNTCRMFANLFQLVKNREMKRLNSPNISVGGFEPFSVVYIEVSNIKNFSEWLNKGLKKKKKKNRNGKSVKH